MAARRRGRPAFVQAKRSPTTWTRNIPTVSFAIPALTKVFPLSFVLNNPGIGETVRRTRGIVSVRNDQQAGIEDITGAFGIVRVGDLALAAGAASLPGPVTDGDDDGWLVWQPFVAMGYALLSSQGGGNTSMQFEFDSKAMRRVEQGFGLAVMIENASATHGIVATFAVSLLSSIS